MMDLKKRSKLVRSSTNVHIKLNINLDNMKNSELCNIVDSLLNEIWNAAWAKEGVEVESLRATYEKEKTTK